MHFEKSTGKGFEFKWDSMTKQMNTHTESKRESNDSKIQWNV